MFVKKMLLILPLLLCAKASAQGWADQNGPTSGVTNIDLEAASGSSPSFTFISYSYYDDAVYSGLIDSISGSTLTLDGFTGTDLEDPTFEDGDLTQSSYLLRLVDGNADGNADMSSTVNSSVFAVLSNVGNEITLNLPADEISTYFISGDGIQIIKANTLDSVFGSGEDFVGLSGPPSSGDNVLIWTTSGWKTYFHYNDKWQTFGTRADQKYTIVYPDEGMVYVRKGGALILSFSGYVSHTRNGPAIMSYIPGGGGKFLMSNPFPISQTIGQLIDTSSNWLSGSNINQADQLLFWSQSTWTTYYHNGSDWINFNTSAVDDRSVEAGEAFFIARPDFGSLVSGYKKINLAE
jgi:hypothetical protein